MDDVVGQGFRLVLGDGDFSYSTAEKAHLPDLKVVRILSSKESNRQSDTGTIVFVEADNIVTSWLQRNDVIAALIRPDNYVFGTAINATEIASLLSDCSQQLGSH